MSYLRTEAVNHLFIASSNTSTSGSLVSSDPVWSSWIEYRKETLVYNWVNSSITLPNLTRWPSPSIERGERAIKYINTQPKSEWEYCSYPAKEVYKQQVEARAFHILMDNLSPGQRTTYIEKGYVPLRSKSGRFFKIYKGRSMNIVEVGEDGNPIQRLCVHPIMGVPNEDTMLSQILMIRFNESLFTRMANKGRLQPENVQRLA